MENSGDCYWSWENERLTVGNDRIERSWIIKDGYWTGRTLLDKTGGLEWLDGSDDSPAFSLPAGRVRTEVRCREAMEDDCGIGSPHLAIYAEYEGEAAAVRFVIRIYPGEAFLRQAVELKRVGGVPENPGKSAGALGERHSAGVRIDGNNTESYLYPEQYIDCFPLVERHVKWSCTAFLDRTDSNNNLVQTASGLLYPNEKRSLRGNLMLLRKTLSPHGLVIVKESPTEYGQLEDLGYDFRWLGPKLFAAGGGIHAGRIPDDDYITAYGTAVGVCDGSEERSLRLLHRYRRSLRRYVPDRDLMIVSNTWGDRNKDGRIREDFIRKEIRVAGRLGITHVQIDDGWQQGVTMNSVVPGGKWGSYYEEGLSFWNVHPERFPNGLAPLVEAAGREGVELGLWFSPDSSANFSHWERDADAILKLYRTYGICCFKLDGIHIESKTGERNLLKMMQKAVKESGAAVCFNLDTTAEVRLGYFGSTQYGSIFLENRYTDWGNYYPHWTLRNLWQLSKYIPAQKLQIEFLNVERNRHQYAGDPLAPAACGILYGWACAIFASPLAWMELSELAEDVQERLAAAITLYRKHQAAILTGMILPIGSEPDGTAWTGFQSLSDERTGYLLIFRELSADSEGTFKLWGVPRSAGAAIRLRTIMKLEKAERLDVSAQAHDETVRTDSGEVRFTLANPLSFALMQYEID